MTGKISSPLLVGFIFSSAAAAAGVPAPGSPAAHPSAAGTVASAPPAPGPSGKTKLLARGRAAGLFPDGADGAKEMVVVGRFLSATPGKRPEGLELLALGVARQRSLGRPDPFAEVFLGETAEAECRARDSAEGRAKDKTGSALPEGLVATPRMEPGTGRLRLVYDGAAFRDALESLACADAADSSLHERAEAGLLRARYPFPSTGLVALAVETGAWVDLLGRSQTREVVSGVADRAGEAALALGRLLLAASRLDDLAALERRVAEEGERARGLLAGRPEAGRLASRAIVLAALRGRGGPAFPQAAGSEGATVSIEGELGALSLVVRRKGEQGEPGRLPGPVLPVPGSLRVSRDGRTAAWLEAASPAAIVPVVVALDTGETLPDAAIVAGGRPGRDRLRAHAVASIAGFSPDGERLAIAFTAWDDDPPAWPRLSSISCRTGELLVDTPGTRLGVARVRRSLTGRPAGRRR